MIRAYIFDLFGTLAFHNLKSAEEIVKDYHEELLVSPFTETKMPDKLKRKLKEMTKNAEIKLYDDSEEIIRQLQQKYAIGMITNIYEITAEKTKQDLNRFFNNFDPLLMSYECRIAKPDPLIFHLALERLDINPEEAVMAGDSMKRDIIPAQQLGMKTIKIDRTKQNLIDLI
ncbi:MAG: HAD family hydrolase [Nanoarchaeota archaeon]